MTKNKIIAGAGVVAGFAVALAPVATFATGSYYPNTHQDKLNVTIEEVCSFGHTYADGTVVNPGSHTDGTGLGSPAETGTVEDTPESGIDAGKSYGKWLHHDNYDSNEDSDYEDEGEWAKGDAQSLATAYDVQDQSGGSGNYVPSTDPTNTTAVFDTAYGVMETNTVNNAFAHTTLAIICNSSAGYKIVAAPDANLVKTAATDPIPFDGDNGMTSASDSAYNFYASDVTTIADTVITTAGATSGVSSQGAGGAIEVAKGAYTTDLANTGIIATQGGATSTLGDRLKITYGVAIDANQEAGTYEGAIVYTLVQL